jgi:hypothetical protein
MSSASKPQPAPVPAPEGEVEKLIRGFVASASGRTPSHLYLELLRVGLQQGWDLGTLDLRHVVALLRESDLEVDSATGRVVRNVA